MDDPLATARPARERARATPRRGAIGRGPPGRGRELACALAGFAALACLWTWPLVARLGTHLPHDARFTAPVGSDVHLFVWDLWWVGEALARGISPFATDALFAPEGHGLALHTHVVLWGVLVAPLERLLGAAVAFGVLLLALFASAATATFALARHVGLSRSASALAGFAWGFSPYFVQKGLEHLNLTASPLPPLAVLAALVWRAGGPRAKAGALATGALLGAALLVDPMAALWTGLLVAGVLVLAPADELSVTPRAERLPRRRGLASPVAWVLALIGLCGVASPYVEPLARELGALAREPESRATSAAREQLYHAELLDFVTPPGLHPVLRERDSPHGDPLQGDSTQSASPLHLGAARARSDAPWSGRRNELAGTYVPLGLLALVAYAAVRLPSTRRWLALAACFLVLAWDPGPEPEGFLSSLYRRLPLLEMLRVPSRALPYALLGLALAAGAALDAWLARPRARVAAYACAGVLAFELWVAPYPTMRFEVPAAVEALRAEHERATRIGATPGAVVVLPMLPGSSPALSWQTVHGLAMPYGYLARLRPSALGRLVRLAPELCRAVAGGPLPGPDALEVELDLLGAEHVLFDARVSADADDWIDVLDAMAGFERRPEGEAAGGGPGADGVLAWSRRRLPARAPSG